MLSDSIYSTRRRIMIILVIIQVSLIMNSVCHTSIFGCVPRPQIDVVCVGIAHIWFILRDGLGRRGLDWTGLEAVGLGWAMELGWAVGLGCEAVESCVTRIKKRGDCAYWVCFEGRAGLWGLGLRIFGLFWGLTTTQLCNYLEYAHFRTKSIKN